MLEEFSCLGKLPEFTACTNRLQEWNKFPQKKVPIILVHQLNARRCEILQKLFSEKSVYNIGTFDPCQPEDRKLGEGAIKKLCSD